MTTTFNENDVASEVIGLIMKMFTETKDNLAAPNKRFESKIYKEHLKSSGLFNLFTVISDFKSNTKLIK